MIRFSWLFVLFHGIVSASTLESVAIFTFGVKITWDEVLQKS